MITFEQVTKIEALRRQIETLQTTLQTETNNTFVISSPSGIKNISKELNIIFREVSCKFTVAKIIKLLDESEHLGVDVTEPKKTLLEFLEEIKPKQEITP